MLGVKIYTLLLLRWLHNPMFGLYLSFCTKKCQNVSKKEMWRNVSKKCEMRNVSKFRIFMVTARLILEHLPAVRLMQWGMQRDMKKKSLIYFWEKFKTMSNFPLRSVYYMKGVRIISEKLFSFPTSWMFSSTWGNKTANTTWLLCISFFFSSVSIFYIQVKCSSRLGVVIHIRAIYSTVSRYRVFYLQKKKQLLMPCVSPQIYPLITRSACQIVFRYHYVDWVIESEL